MLTSLRLTNYFYTDSLDIRLTPGLNIITGATGSGKSVLVSAIEAALGSRKLLAAAEASQKSIIECEFQVDHVDEWLTEQDLELLPALQMRRELRPDNSSRYFINDTPALMKQVRELGDRLVDFHAQNDLSLLLRKKYHTDYVDSYAGTTAARKQYDERYRSWRQTSDRLEQLEAQLEREKEQRELRSFQLRELQTAQLQSEEDSELTGREKVLANAELMLSDIEMIRQLLDGEEGSVRSALYQVQKGMERIRSHTGLAAEALETLKQGVIAIEDVVHQTSALDEQVEHNPELLEEIRQRLELVNSLKRKYGPTLAQVLERQQSLEESSDQLQQLQQERDQLEELAEQKLSELQESASRLTRARRKSGKQIAKDINPLLFELGITGEGLEVKLTPRNEFPHASGIEQCEFHIATNPGMPAEPLEEVASGGELSRVMLALKSLSADFQSQSVLVFDEIDRGVSGRAAAAVGKRLQALSRTRQVICITHLPQIAALADCHLSVIKESDADSTRIRVAALDHRQRVEELALLAGGDEVTSADREYANQLLSREN